MQKTLVIGCRKLSFPKGFCSFLVISKFKMPYAFTYQLVSPGFFRLLLGQYKVITSVPVKSNLATAFRWFVM
jgi:hypothetical protein